MSKETDESNIIHFRAQTFSAQEQADTSAVVPEAVVENALVDARVQVVRELLASHIVSLPADIQVALKRMAATGQEEDDTISFSLARLRRESESAKNALHEREKST